MRKWKEGKRVFRVGFKKAQREKKLKEGGRSSTYTRPTFDGNKTRLDSGTVLLSQAPPVLWKNLQV